MVRSTAVIAILTIVVSGCGDATGSDARYPEIAGIYEFTAPADGVPVVFAGEIGITDDSRTTPEFSGVVTYNVFNSEGALVAEGGTGQILNATIAAGGQLEMHLVSTDFRVSGGISGREITGSFLLRNYNGADVSGIFAATRK